MCIYIDSNQKQKEAEESSPIPENSDFYDVFILWVNTMEEVSDCFTHLSKHH